MRGRAWLIRVIRETENVASAIDVLFLHYQLNVDESGSEHAQEAAGCSLQSTANPVSAEQLRRVFGLNGIVKDHQGCRAIFSRAGSGLAGGVRVERRVHHEPGVFEVFLGDLQFDRQTGIFADERQRLAADVRRDAGRFQLLLHQPGLAQVGEGIQHDELSGMHDAGPCPGKDSSLVDARRESLSGV